MSRSHDTNAAVEAFIRSMKALGLASRKPQPLAVPYFEGEFNRCVEHQVLNNLVQSTQPLPGSGWYQVGMACRLGDTKKIEFGWHTTVFEILTAVQCLGSSYNETTNHLANSVVDFLVSAIGLERALLRVTYFAGGDVVPGVTVEPDEVGRTAFLEAGIPEPNLVPVRGPKNYVLFVGGGERAGPKYEIQYQINSGHGARWVEVATAIHDCYQLSRSAGARGKWALEAPPSPLWGCAFGLERLMAAANGWANIWNSSVLSELLIRIGDACGQAGAAEDLVKGDQLILGDLARSVMFLLSDGVSPNEDSTNGRLLAGMVARIRRKIAVLAIREWTETLESLADIVVRHYERRYPGIGSVREDFVESVERALWPESWNPDTYVPNAS